MTKHPTARTPEIAIQWRDENYGGVTAAAAFRIYSVTDDWSERAKARFNACLKKTGFAFDERRCSYIAPHGEKRQIALCTALADAGFKITNGDVREDA